MDKMSFAAEFARCLRSSGKTPEQVAREVGLTSPTIVAKIAAGEIKPSLDIAEALSRAVGGNVNRLARLALLGWFNEASIEKVRRLLELAADDKNESG